MEGLVPLSEDDEHKILIWKIDKIIWALEQRKYQRRIYVCWKFIQLHVWYFLLQHYGFLPW